MEKLFLCLLTALDGIGRCLQRNGPAIGLVDVYPKYQPHTCVFTPDVRFSFAELDVRIAQFQDPSTVDSAAKAGQNISEMGPFDWKEVEDGIVLAYQGQC